MRRKLNPRLISLRREYSFKEIAQIFGLHIRTVQKWPKHGLKILDGTLSPILVLGSDLKEFLKEKISLETLIILDRIIEFSPNFDKKFRDTVWKLISQRMKKYSSFLNIKVLHYKKILQEIVLWVFLSQTLFGKKWPK